MTSRLVVTMTATGSTYGGGRGPMPGADPRCQNRPMLSIGVVALGVGDVGRATTARSSTASKLAWFAGLDRSKRSGIIFALLVCGASLPLRNRPVSQPPASGRHKKIPR